MGNSQKIIEVVGGIIRRGDRYLLGKRPLGKSQGGHWEFIGGKIEPGETPEQALARECREEIALEIVNEEIRTSVTHAYPDRTIHLTLIDCEPASGAEPTALEHSELGWFAPEEMKGLDFCAADAELLTVVFENKITKDDYTMKKTVVYICKSGENALESMRGDGLLIMGCGYGDPGWSGMKEVFGDIGDEFLYRLGDEKPYRFAYYCGNGSPSEALKCLLTQGCRSVIVDFGMGTDNSRSNWVRELAQLEDVIIVNSDRRIRPDLKVGELARLAFLTYLQSRDCDPAEIVRLQDGDYCHDTFILNSTMPVLVPVSVIDNAPNGARIGEADFYRIHYWNKVVEVDGIKYRVVNDWKEPTTAQPRDNRTPLEDWIRRMGIVL